MQGRLELGHPGLGGQNVKWVPSLGLSFAYLTNGLTPDMGDDTRKFGALRAAVYETLRELGAVPHAQQPSILRHLTFT